MDTIVIPGWVLSNVGGFVGLVILSGILFRTQTHHQERKKQKIRDREQEKRETKRKKDQERVLLLERLLPGPWRTLYEFLNGHPKLTRQSVILAAITFKRDIDDIPKICPGGFDLILEVSYYDVGGSGNCHKEFAALLEDHVKFPKNYGN